MRISLGKKKTPLSSPSYLEILCGCHPPFALNSEARGHENPVFLGDGPQPKTRTVSQILTRQSSETGRHLLSDPGTPLSPPAHGDVFFPAHGESTVYLKSATMTS